MSKKTNILNLICRFYEIPRNKKRGIIESWSKSFIFYMCIADIYCKILSSLRYIEMLAVLEIISLEFGKYTITEQGQ